jgi:hypothetical protein
LSARVGLTALLLSLLLLGFAWSFGASWPWGATP